MRRTKEQHYTLHLFPFGVRVQTSPPPPPPPPSLFIRMCESANRVPLWITSFFHFAILSSHPPSSRFGLLLLYRIVPGVEPPPSPSLQRLSRIHNSTVRYCTSSHEMPSRYRKQGNALLDFPPFSKLRTSKIYDTKNSHEQNPSCENPSCGWMRECMHWGGRGKGQFLIAHLLPIFISSPIVNPN